MRILTIFSVAIFNLVALKAVVFAQLSWESRQLSFNPKLGKESVSGEFKFQNKSDRTISILSIKTSCGCTTAELVKRTYEPGESGSLSATLDIRRRFGFQQKSIVVETDDLADPLVQLTIEANVQVPITVEPNGAYWSVGSAAETKTLTLKPNPNLNLNILEAKSTNYDIFPQLETVASGKEYILRITPRSTESPAKATIILVTDYPKDKPRQFDVKAEIN